MKKLILGLLLTVGVSGISFANQIDNQKDFDNITTEFLNQYTAADYNDFDYKTEDNLDLKKIEFVDCYNVLKYRISIDGHNYDITLSAEEGPCGEGVEDGSIIFTIIRA